MNTLTNIQEKKFPAALWALTFCAFGIGTAEFIIMGLLSTIAKDLSTSISSAGLLVSLYALGVAVGGPILSAVTAKMERKKLLLIAIAVFVLGNFIAVLAQGLFALLISRIISGAIHGLFMGNATTIAGNIVPTNKKATAISIIFAGFLISTVVGVPLGTYIGTNWGWRTTFLAVSVWGILGFIFTTLLLPNKQHPENILKLKEHLKVLKNKALILILLTNIFAYTGTFTFFTFISQALIEISGFAQSSISIVLLILGSGVALGNITGGRFSNRKPALALLFMLIFHAIILFVLPLVFAYQVSVIVCLFLFGFFAYSNVPALQLLSIQLSERFVPGSGNIASALNVSAFNVGAAAGAYIGGLVVDSTLGLQYTPWVGTIFVIIALILAVLNWLRNSHNETNEK